MNYGSLNNMLSGTPAELLPVVGMGATQLCWSDRHPFTIVRVSPSGKTIWVKADNAKRIDNNGMSESQSYEYSPNDSSPEIEVRKNKKGQWVSLKVRNNWLVGRSDRFVLGCREEYYDYSF